MKAYVFDTRMTTDIKNNWRKGMHTYQATGLFNTWQHPGQAFTVLEIPPSIQVRMQPFAFGEKWGLLTIDGGMSLYKFPMPRELKDEYDAHKFYFDGARFILEVRIDQIQE